MSTPNFKPMPQNLSDDERRDWLRRQRTAENTLAIQALGGTEPNQETLSQFQRYVSGEITLAQAIAQVREQMAQEHAAFRQYLNRGSII
ncbi:antitoxin VbhA family protein [Hymenobacter sp. B1770]|uniref:antitoxin VbhA family protein n=1 Tax=Hymenobacter sp. B1770 TaxID=1718788 RepID=UPI003CEF41CC